LIEKNLLISADIYGPSIPALLGLDSNRPNVDEHNKIIPLEAHGLKAMSIGFLVNKNDAVMWRGPMVQV
tara:strand:+ start:156 stop:362 length:207 start_codon:yes stop_codon:yes gene_type:complete